VLVLKDKFKMILLWYRDLSVQKKILLLNLMNILIPILLLAFSATKVSSSIVIKNTIDNSVRSLSLVIQNLDNLVKNTEKTANIFVSNERIQEISRQMSVMTERERLISSQSVSSMLDGLIEPGNEAKSAAITGIAGYVAVTNSIDLSAFKDEFMASQKEKNNLSSNAANRYWQSLHTVGYIRRNKSTDCITFHKKVIDALSGDIDGSLIINIDECVIADSFLSLSDVNSGVFFISDREGTIISSTQKDMLYQSVKGKIYYDWLKKNELAGHIFMLDGEKKLVVNAKYPYMGWNIVGIISINKLTSESIQVTYLILLTGVICLILALISLIVISRFISKPIIKLSKTMMHVGKGNFDIGVLPDGNDEIGLLSKNFSSMTYQISNLMKRVLDEQEKKREFEFLALQTQINPHFLYNTLDSICSLVQMNMNEEAFIMVKKLAFFYRTSLSKGESIITIKEEAENAESYLTIQKIRYYEQFEYHIEIEPEILSQKIAKLSIQPLIENSIYHAIKNKRGKGKIEVYGRKYENDIIISVVDDGIGMSEDEIKYVFSGKVYESRKKSFGVKSVDDRLKLYFGMEYGVKIYSQPGKGTRVDLILPYNIEGR
jgi:Predicted signal transduction protein with a C-terminal ATPase domain